MRTGEIYRDIRFYVDRETGELRSKYLLLLTATRSGDWVARLLTSRENGRPRNPPCYHGSPYPGFYLGVPGDPLDVETWVDLRYMPDVDSDAARTRIASGVLTRVRTLASGQLCDILECVAAAPDTTMAQERALRDRLSDLR